MKVKELVNLLEKCDPEAEVIISRDEEGNGFSPLYEVCDNQSYIPDNAYSGEIALRELTDELINAGYSEEDVYTGEGSVKAVVLWPTN